MRFEKKIKDKRKLKDQMKYMKTEIEEMEEDKDQKEERNEENEQVKKATLEPKKKMIHWTKEQTQRKI